MTWTIRLAKEAEKQVKKLPADRQALILTHLREMRDDPFQGDVIALKGKEWKGWYRKRVGNYRIIFSPDRTKQIVDIAAIVPRSEKTYK